MSELATATALPPAGSSAVTSASVTSASPASDFTALFPNDDQAAATTVFQDLVQIVTDSGVTAG